MPWFEQKSDPEHNLRTVGIPHYVWYKPQEGRNLTFQEAVELRDSLVDQIRRELGEDPIVQITFRAPLLMTKPEDGSPHNHYAQVIGSIEEVSPGSTWYNALENYAAHSPRSITAQTLKQGHEHVLSEIKFQVNVDYNQAARLETPCLNVVPQEILSANLGAALGNLPHIFGELNTTAFAARYEAMSSRGLDATSPLAMQIAGVIRALSEYAPANKHEEWMLPLTIDYLKNALTHAQGNWNIADTLEENSWGLFSKLGDVPGTYEALRAMLDIARNQKDESLLIARKQIEQAVEMLDSRLATLSEHGILGDEHPLLAARIELAGPRHLPASEYPEASVLGQLTRGKGMHFDR